MDPRERGLMLEAEAELNDIRNKRYRLLDRLDDQDRRAGELAGELIGSGGRTQTEVARTLGVSAPHVAKLISRRAEHSPQATEELVPLIPFYEVGRYLTETGASPKRIIAGFEQMAVLLESGLSPDLFADDDFLLIPHILLETSNGRSVGVDRVHIGYGGTGPNHAKDLLLGLDLGEEVARHALRDRFFVVDISEAEGKAVVSTGYEHSGVRISGPLGTLPKPDALGPVFKCEFHRDDIWMSRMGGSQEANVDGDDQVGSVLDDERFSGFRNWIDTLDGDDLPDWLVAGPQDDSRTGPRDTRMARVFLDPAEAARQGFVSRFHRARQGLYGNTYQIVIEQGRFQMWLQDYNPTDPTQPLSDEAYEVLAYAGLYPKDMADLRPQARFSRYWRRVLGAPQPAYIDISESGEGTLNFVPSRDLRGRGDGISGAGGTDAGGPAPASQ